MEKWKACKEESPFHEVSSRGRIRSIGRSIINKNGKKLFIKAKIMKPVPNRYGYMLVTFKYDLKSFIVSLHRLVAKYFVPNPENKPVINHKNGKKGDNRAQNLEWVTTGENLQHSYRVLGRDRKAGKKCWLYGKKGKEHPAYTARCKKVLCQTTGIVYESASMAARDLCISQTGISAACRGVTQSIKGLKFKYIE